MILVVLNFKNQISVFKQKIKRDLVAFTNRAGKILYKSIHASFQ